MAEGGPSGLLSPLVAKSGKHSFCLSEKPSLSVVCTPVLHVEEG